MLQCREKGDIINQYVAFTRIFDEQIRIHGRTRKAVEETLRICREEEVLTAYLAKEEMADIMFTFVDKEKQLERYVEEERKEEKISSIRELMKNMKWTAKQAMTALGMSAEEQAMYKRLL